MKYSFALIEDNIDIRKEISEYFTGSQLLDCVMAVDSVEKFLKYHRDFLEIKLVLLDVMLYNQSSIYSIPHILQREPEAEIIIFTVLDDSNVIFQALTYGATGYLLKDVSMPELEKLLYSVIVGMGALLSPSIAKKIIQSLIPKTDTTDPDSTTLSEREHIVIHLLKEGRTYEQISLRLGLSVNGVRYYIKSVYRKLQVKSRGELIRKRLDFKNNNMCE
jgi:DNA-binding NarL/FixJ family response regulator